MAQQHNRKSVSVFVNAGEKAVTFTRRDLSEWEFPLFVNVPNGVREFVVELLDKQWDDNAGRLVATNVISWDIPAGRIERSTISKGDNAGKPMLSVTIPVESLKDWLTKELVIRKKGAVSDEVADILATAREMLGAPNQTPATNKVSTEDLPF